VAEERRDLAMACGTQGRFANAVNLLSECTRYLQDPKGLSRDNRVIRLAASGR
jgi:hypothetical protein